MVTVNKVCSTLHMGLAFNLGDSDNPKILLECK